MVFCSTTYSDIANGMVICDSCTAVERDLRKMAIKGQNFAVQEMGSIDVLIIDICW